MRLFTTKKELIGISPLLIFIKFYFCHRNSLLIKMIYQDFELQKNINYQINKTAASESICYRKEASYLPPQKKPTIIAENNVWFVPTYHVTVFPSFSTHRGHFHRCWEFNLQSVDTRFPF